MADKKIGGYAVVFRQETKIAGAFREQIAPGAFDRSLRENPDVLALWNHDPSRILGRTVPGTLALKPDRVGLWFELTPNEATPDGQTALGAVERQDVAGCSFGFFVCSERWDEGSDSELPLRTILEAELVEITLTGFPAYEQTSAKILRCAAVPDAQRKIDNAQSAARRVSGRRAIMEQKIRGIRQ